ncbi:acyltransferase [Shewanella frigidimarina]|uniref:acyltransferase n=1 Tax=Shewanella frigidimarina TaxID=56812 RepID=UPI003D7BF300
MLTTKKLIDLFLDLPSYLLNTIQLKLFKIQVGGASKVNGYAHFRNKGVFIIGENVTINSGIKYNQTGGQFLTSIVVTKNAHFVIGENSGLSNSSIYCAKSITIGENVMIGGGCRIFDTDFHSLNYLERFSKNDSGKSKSVIIKDGAFIGAGVIILKGTIVGSKSVIGAGSVVSGVVPDSQIWAGNPATFIRNISGE